MADHFAIHIHESISGAVEKIIQYIAVKQLLPANIWRKNVKVMRFSMLFSALCATALCSNTWSAHGEDNAAQAAARAMLMPALAQTNAPDTVTNTSAAAPATETPAVQPAAAPVAGPDVAPISSVGGGDNAAQAAARAVFLQSAGSTPVAAPDATTRVPAVTAPATPITPATATGPDASVAPVAAPAPPAAPAPVSVTIPAPASPRFSMAPQVSAPAAPPLPLTAEQQAQLQALDAKYSANQISPADYFTQREAILKGQ